MELFLIRHTAPAIESGVCYGRADIPLAEAAELDIEATMAPLPKFDHVYSSPAQRCARLARALAERDSCKLTLAEELQELDFGQWEQLPWTRIPREHSDLWAADTWHRAPPGGETEQALWNRVASWYQATLPASASRCAIVAHGGSLRVLRCLILRLGMEQRWEWNLSWGQHAAFKLT